MPLTDEQAQTVSILQSAILVIRAQNAGITRMVGDSDNIPFVALSAAETGPVFAAIANAYQARVETILATLASS